MVVVVVRSGVSNGEVDDTHSVSSMMGTCSGDGGV